MKTILAAVVVAMLAMEASAVDYSARVRIWLRAHGMPGITVLNQTGEEVSFMGDANGVPYRIASVNVGAGVTPPTFADLQAITPEAEAAEVAASTDLIVKAAALGQGVKMELLVAAVAELAKEIEKIKLVVRTIHPAAAGELPAKNKASWVADIKATAITLDW